jgi:hypothetical protein
MGILLTQGVIMKNLVMTFLILGMVGCASNKIKQLDTEIDVKGQTSNGGVIGLQNDYAMIQEKRSAEEELRIQQWRNYQVENDLNHEYHMTEWCYSDLADPRLGGTGDVAEAPDMSKLKSSPEIKEELGLEGEKLVVVKTYSYPEKLKIERDYEQAMTVMLKEVKKTRAACERKMGAARLKAGLPAKRQQGQITVTPSGQVKTVLKEHEHSLDDAFRMKKSTEPKRVPSAQEESSESTTDKEPTAETEPTQESESATQNSAAVDQGNE